MYALYLVGPIVEGLYGSARFLLFYLLTAAAASMLSYVITPNDAVGASGAIFGLFGILFVAQRIHHPLMDRQARSIATQIGALIVINLVIGFGLAGGGVGIDNLAHIGGLLAGAWLGLAIAPRVPTLATSFTRPGEAPPATSSRSILLQVAAVIALVAVIGVGVAFGTVAADRPRPGSVGDACHRRATRAGADRASRRGPELDPVRDQQVAARPEAVDDAVEVALAQPVAFGGRQAGVAAMLMAVERQRPASAPLAAAACPRPRRAGPGSTRCPGCGRSGSARRAGRAATKSARRNARQ